MVVLAALAVAADLYAFLRIFPIIQIRPKIPADCHPYSLERNDIQARKKFRLGKKSLNLSVFAYQCISRFDKYIFEFFICNLNAMIEDYTIIIKFGYS